MTQEVASTPSLNLSNLNNVCSSPISSTPLSSRVSQLKQLWEENIKKEEITTPTNTPRNPVKTRHSVRIDYLPLSNNNSTPSETNNFTSPVKSITSFNKNISAYFHSSSPSSSSNSNNNNHNTNNINTNQPSASAKSPEGNTVLNKPEITSSSPLERTTTTPTRNKKETTVTTPGEKELVSTSSKTPSRVSQTIFKFTQLIQKTTSNATTTNKTKTTETIKLDKQEFSNEKIEEKSIAMTDLEESSRKVQSDKIQLPSSVTEEIKEISSIETLDKQNELVQTAIEPVQFPEPIPSIAKEVPIHEEGQQQEQTVIPIIIVKEEVQQIVEEKQENQHEETPTIPEIITLQKEQTQVDEIKEENTTEIIRNFVGSIFQNVKENHIELTSPHSTEEKQEGNTSTSSTDSNVTDNILTSIDTVDTEINNGDLTESGHSSSLNEVSDDDATCNDDDETPSPVVPKLSGMDILSFHNLKPISDSRMQMESKSGHFAEALSSSSTISFNIGSVFKDVEIEKNEDYAKYFRKTNFNSYQENVTSIVESDKRRSKSMVKKLLETQLISQKIKRIVNEYRKQHWVHKKIFHSLGSKGFEDFTSSKIYLDEDELEDDDEFEQVFHCGLFEQGEKIVNSLYEEEIAFVNPLYDEEYISTNPLFDPTEDLTVCIYNFEEDEKAFVTRLKAGIPRQKNLIRSKFNRMHAKSFSGSDLVDWIMESSHDKFLRLDAVWFAQQMMDRMVFISMDKFTSKFEDDPAILYIFTDEYESSNTLNVDPNTIGVFEPQSSYMSIYRVLKQVGKDILVKYDQSSKYNDLPIFDYQGFAFSEHFVIVLNEMRKLQKIDTTSMIDPTFRKCFFINIHNIMVLHTLITCGKPTNFLLRKRFFRKKKYMIGRYKLSLDMIAHGILRGEKYQRKSSGNINVGKDSISSSFREKLFKTSGEDNNPLLNAISNLRIPDFDPRIHFCLFRADMSSPKFNLFSVENLESEIDKATREFIQRETRIDAENGIIYVSKIFEWFKEDFGSQQVLLEYLFKYLDTGVSSKIYMLKQRGLEDINIEYKYNSSLNIPSNISSDDNKEVNVELELIRSSEKLRPYFIAYCEQEHSEENILFWARVEEFKTLMDSSKQLEEGRKIYDEYMRLGSPSELNVSRRMVHEIESELYNENDDPIRADIFDPIQRVIGLLMIDTYERFVTSSHYKQVVEVLREEMNLEVDTPRKSTSPIFISTSSEDVLDSTISFKDLQHRRSRMSEIRTTDAPLTSRVTSTGGTPESPASSPVTSSPRSSSVTPFQ